MITEVSVEPKKKTFAGEGPIRSVGVASTGTVDLHHEHVYGTRKPAMWWIFFGKRFVTVPINFFVVEHANGLVLFDAGQDRAVITNEAYWPEGFTGTVMKKLFRMSISPDETPTRQLERLGYSLSDVNTVVFSHLHADHIGNVKDLTHARLFVSLTEWDNMLEPHADRHMIFSNYIRVTGADWTKITFPASDDPSVSPFANSYDLMGDGSMILLPTPGHTPGSMSMLVRPEMGPPLLLAADLSYNPELLRQNRLPGTGDNAQLLDSFAQVRALKERIPELVLLFSHDPMVAETLASC